MNDSVQLIGISNAIVDVLSHEEKDLISKLGVAPGSMTLIDEDRAHEVYDMMGPSTEMSGGSVANTVAGFANLGGNAAYIGRVKNDQFGEIFNHDMRSLGIDIRLQPSETGAPTARCHVMITDDGQRTMNTYLGACVELSADDISDTSIGTPKAMLIEGYVWDIEEGATLIQKAMDIASDKKIAVALSLSDAHCVERHQASFAQTLNGDASIIVGDEDEVMMLLGTQSFDETVSAAQNYNCIFAITRSEKGSVIVNRNDVHVQSASPVERVKDTTGAGDAYCAGFLYGWVNDKPISECARIGTLCASEVIQQVGGRIQREKLSL